MKKFLFVISLNHLVLFFFFHTRNHDHQISVIFFLLLRHYLQIVFYFFCPSSSYRRSSVLSPCHDRTFPHLSSSADIGITSAAKWLIIFDSSNYIIHFMQRFFCIMFDVRECVLFWCLAEKFGFVVAICRKTKWKIFLKEITGIISV